MDNANGWLSEGEKTLIAMGAAMGAGCRTCAEKLQRIALDQDLKPSDILDAFLTGLEGKAEALQTMKEKVNNLLGKGKDEAGAPKGRDERLAALIRIASLMASNSAPDACLEMGKAFKKGVTEREIKVCRSIARMVRDQAMKFSDREIKDNRPSEAGEGEIRDSVPGFCGSGCDCGCV